MAGRGLGRYKRYKRIPSVGLLVAIAALAVLAARDDMPLGIVAVLLVLAGGGIGTMYPVTTVLMQNAVLPHQFGVATGTLNFFRLLGGTIVVAGFGAIVLGTIGGTPALEPFHRGTVLHSGPIEADFSQVFSWVFAAAAACLAAALAALAIVEERPLRGPTKRQPAQQDDMPIAAE